jgi:hypothetical protein
MFYLGAGAGYTHFWIPQTSTLMGGVAVGSSDASWFGMVTVDAKLGWKIVTNKTGKGFFVEPSLGYNYPISLVKAPDSAEAEALTILRMVYSFKFDLALGWAF